MNLSCSYNSTTRPCFFLASAALWGDFTVCERKKESSANNFMTCLGNFLLFIQWENILKLILPYATSTMANDDWGVLKEWHSIFSFCVLLLSLPHYHCCSLTHPLCTHIHECVIKIRSLLCYNFSASVKASSHISLSLSFFGAHSTYTLWVRKEYVGAWKQMVPQCQPSYE